MLFMFRCWCDIDLEHTDRLIALLEVFLLIFLPCTTCWDIKIFFLIRTPQELFTINTTSGNKRQNAFQGENAKVRMLLGYFFFLYVIINHLVPKQTRSIPKTPKSFVLNLNDDPSATISLHYSWMKPLSICPSCSFTWDHVWKLKFPFSIESQY